MNAARTVTEVTLYACRCGHQQIAGSTCMACGRRGLEADFAPLASLSPELQAAYAKFREAK